MAKTANLYARIEPEVKNQAESILEALGIPVSSAINMFYKQIILQRGIPFEMKLPDFPVPDISTMTAAPIRFRAPLIASGDQGTSLINSPPVLKHMDARKTHSTDLFLTVISSPSAIAHTVPQSRKKEKPSAAFRGKGLLGVYP